jgi:opacity protein-like surface antigen
MKLILIILASLGALSAQNFEVSFSGGQSLLQNANLGSASTSGPADDFKLTDGFRFGFRMTVNNLNRFGHEFGYAYSRTKLQSGGSSEGAQGMAIHSGFYDFLLYGTREGARIRPFAAGGGHFSNFVPPGSSATQGGGSTKVGLNYGGGVKFKLAESWLLRLDVRQYITGKPFGLYNASGILRQTEISAGIGFTL